MQNIFVRTNYLLLGLTHADVDIDVGVDGVGLGVADPTEVVAVAVFSIDIVDFSIELLAVGVSDALIDAIDDDVDIRVVVPSTATCMVVHKIKTFMNS